MSQSVASRHWLRVVSRWPKDELRPVQFQETLRRRIKQTNPPETQTETDASRKAPLGWRAAAPMDGRAELEQINAAYSLLGNRYGNMYRLSPQFMEPASKPTYYKDLIAELDAAPHRTWWQAWLNSWKGFIRMR